MTIRGGGNPYTAMAAMPLGEWTRRLGALPAEAYDCFMVGTLYGFNRIQAWFARDCSWPMAGSPRACHERHYLALKVSGTGPGQTLWIPHSFAHHAEPLSTEYRCRGSLW